jgi:hypothetical protein
VQHYHVLQASTDKHLSVLRWAAETGESVDWTVNRQARPNDLAVFYFIRSRSAFLAVGVIADKPAK